MASQRKNLYRLSPGAVAEDLFCLAPDRDERAPQLCAETLLTLRQNDYCAPDSIDDLQSPKRQLFAVRSLALGENFLGGRSKGRVGDPDTSPEEYGDRLASGDQVRGSANLQLAQLTLQGLIDPETQRGQKGAWLLRPFHESLLWYDARKPSPRSSEYTVRKVYMRGSGITLARLLADPADSSDAALGKVAVGRIREELNAASPLADIGSILESALPSNETWTDRRIDLEEDEESAWRRGADPRLAGLARSLCRHAEGIMLQGNASGPAKLWQLRCMLGLDLALHVLRTAWDATDTPSEDRFLLLSFGGSPRAQDPVRQRSEESYRRARIRLSEATVRTLAKLMRELKEEDKVTAFSGEFRDRTLADARSHDSVTNQLTRLPLPAGHEEYLRLARLAVETANYSRGSEDGFRVLLESVGMLVGTGSYRYLTATPDLLGAMVGALSNRMPMSSRDFIAAAREEWDLVINQESAAETALAAQLDGARLAQNARAAERLMSDAGLAVGLSDRTTMVGERASRSHR
ncbi:hypothetical protein GCM10027449_11430 [Sinomonas notoginsengisoli]|uniref:hypothetical protein n=1 Tax=Sinomonas notoginsengisoli TaxID=1457311 RepID=UPI001F3BA118|nr:hypothetical protein [Sinomonas notoginsengisoli]